MLGTTLGNYRLERELGRGGMGAVYIGTHQLLGRPAAIKVLLAKYSLDQDIVQRFFNEARAATAIEHPGIVEVYDYGKDESGCAYIVMELCQGESLGTRIRRKHRFTIAAALTITRQIAGSLAAAHKVNIVHRDLKPDNVFVVPDAEVTGGERIKLLDFGIAKLATDTAGPMKTTTGVIMGTPNYMSPEQCRGAGQVDHRSDLYSLGCMLFELMCGRVPFIGEGSGDVIGAHLLTAPPAPSSFAPNIPPDIERLILSLLAKKPADRPDHADLVIAELARIADALPVETLETVRSFDVVLEPTRAFVDVAAPTAASVPPRIAGDSIGPASTGAAAAASRPIQPRTERAPAATARGHAGATATNEPPGLDPDVAYASTEVSTATPADNRRTTDRRASGEDRRGSRTIPPARTDDRPARTAPSKDVRRSSGRSRALLLMVGGAVLVIAGAIVYLATRSEPAPTAVPLDTSRMRIVVGEVTGADASDTARRRIRSLLIAHLATRGELQVAMWPGPDEEAAGRAGRAMTVTAHVSQLVIDPDREGRVKCAYALTLADYPGRTTLAVATGNAGIDTKSSALNALDAGAEECVAALIDDMIATRVLPVVRDRTARPSSEPMMPSLRLLIGEIGGEGITPAIRDRVRVQLDQLARKHLAEYPLVPAMDESLKRAQRLLVLTVDLKKLEPIKGELECVFVVGLSGVPQKGRGTASISSETTAAMKLASPAFKDIEKAALGCVDAGIAGESESLAAWVREKVEADRATPADGEPPRKRYEISWNPLVPTPNGPPEDIEAPSPDEPFDNVSLAGTLLAHRSRYERCYLDALARDPKLATTATFTFTVDADGKAIAIKTVDGDKALATCVVAAVAKIGFPKPQAPSHVTFTIPFRPPPR